MIEKKQLFLASINSRNRLRVTFYSKSDNQVLTRECAPMDYGPSRAAHDKSNRFHFWDYESADGPHVLSLRPEQVVVVQRLAKNFEPLEFVTWTPRWHVQRDWGLAS